MQREDFHEVSDLDALRMENDLLVLENRLLRSRLDASSTKRGRRSDAEVKRLVARAVKAERDRILETVASDNEERRAMYRSVPHAQYEEMRKAGSDLQWLIRRIESSPLSVVFGRLSGWRQLVERHGEGSDET